MEEIENSFKLSINYSSTEHFSLNLNKQILSMEEIAIQLNNKIEEIKSNYINNEIFNITINNLHESFEEIITQRDKKIEILEDVIKKQEKKIKNLEENLFTMIENKNENISNNLKSNQKK